MDYHQITHHEYFQTVTYKSPEISRGSGKKTKDWDDW